MLYLLTAIGLTPCGQ